MTAVVHHGDSLEILAGLGDASIDAVVTDPPYEIGYSGLRWDRQGIAFSIPLWTELLRVAKPGAYLCAFGATRTSHRMATALEQAGWQLRDTIAWIYAQGCPRSRTSLKPAHEPITVARKPLTGTLTANVARHGTGELDIDNCRIPRTGGGGRLRRVGGPPTSSSMTTPPPPSTPRPRTTTAPSPARPNGSAPPPTPTPLSSPSS